LCVCGVQLNRATVDVVAGNGRTRYGRRTLARGQVAVVVVSGRRARLAVAGRRRRRRGDRLPATMYVAGGVARQVQGEGDARSSAVYRQGLFPVARVLLLYVAPTVILKLCACVLCVCARGNISC